MPPIPFLGAFQSLSEKVTLWLRAAAPWMVGSIGTENWAKAQQHTAQEVTAIPLQKLSHKFGLLQGTFANEPMPIPP